MKPTSCPELLRAMVGFDTVNGNISGRAEAEADLARYLEARAAAWGLEARRLPVKGRGFNLLVSHRVAAGAPWLLFDSHLDTVSAEGMTVEPFAGWIREGRLYGRGACDTKGTGAAILWALQQYAAGGGAANNVALLYSVDEEVSKSGVRSFIEHHLPSLGWKPAGVIIGEPTELKPVVAHNGVVRWRIRTRGRAAHSSDPAQGRSAISMMVKVIEALEARYIPALGAKHAMTGRAQCSINVIRGGVQINVIPEQCEIQLDRRVVPGEEPGQVLPAVERILDELRRADDRLDVTQLEPDNIALPLDPGGSEQFAAFAQAILTQMDLPAELLGVSYGTHGSNFSHAGLPTVVLGPGSVAQAHTHNEWIDLAQLERGAAVYLRLMRSPVGEFMKKERYH